MDSGYTLVLLPGLNNSGPGHWQSHWQLRLPHSLRAEMPDWDRPHRDEWMNALDAYLAGIEGRCVIAAHSLGCIAVAHWAARGPGNVAAALLVAPPDIETPGMPEEVLDFAPVPLAPLPFPSLVVASGNDPYCSLGRARQFAGAWGSGWQLLGDAGHINDESGLGDWPEGLQLLDALIRRAA
jgi:predicted alpha/beta hydrolase family esterase